MPPSYDDGKPIEILSFFESWRGVGEFDQIGKQSQGTSREPCVRNYPPTGTKLSAFSSYIYSIPWDFHFGAAKFKYWLC